MYFSGNPFSNLLMQGKEASIKNVLAYTKSLSKLDGSREIFLY